MVSIFVSDDGTVEFTRKPELLNMFAGERKEIVRMTDIMHEPDQDLYYIKFLTGEFKGQIVSVAHLLAIGEATKKAGYDAVPFTDKLFFIDSVGFESNVVGFASYEAAVRAEVSIVDDMRRVGMAVQ